MSLNLRKLQHVAGHSLKNGVRLHFDSIILFKNKSYSTAFFISVLAMEEIGKAYWADHFVFYSKDVRGDKDLESEWINTLLRDHKQKQLFFLRQMAKVDDKFYQFVKSRQLDILKQNSIYVGLQKPRAGQPRTSGNIIKPKDFKLDKVKRQINLIHDFLTDEINGIQKEQIQHSLSVFNDILDERLLIKLNKRMK